MVSYCKINNDIYSYSVSKPQHKSKNNNKNEQKKATSTTVPEQETLSSLSVSSLMRDDKSWGSGVSRVQWEMTSQLKPSRKSTRSFTIWWHHLPFYTLQAEVKSQAYVSLLTWNMSGHVISSLQFLGVFVTDYTSIMQCMKCDKAKKFTDISTQTQTWMNIAEWKHSGSLKVFRSFAKSNCKQRT